MFLLNFCLLSIVFGAEEDKIAEKGYKQDLQEIQDQVRTRTLELIEGKTDTPEIDENYKQFLDKLSNIYSQSEDLLVSKTEKNLSERYLYDDIELNITKIRSELKQELPSCVDFIVDKFNFCNHLMYFSGLKGNTNSATETIKQILSEEKRNLCEYMKSLKKRFSEFINLLEEFGQLADKLSESISKENSITDN